MEFVNHPDHYNSEGKKECIEEIKDDFGTDVVFDGCIFNIYKYLYRKGSKAENSEIQDIEKAKWYCDYAAKMIMSGGILDINKIVMIISSYGRLSDELIKTIKDETNEEQ